MCRASKTDFGGMERLELFIPLVFFSPKTHALLYNLSRIPARDCYFTDTTTPCLETGNSYILELLCNLGEKNVRHAWSLVLPVELVDEVGSLRPNAFLKS